MCITLSQHFFLLFVKEFIIYGNVSVQFSFHRICAFVEEKAGGCQREEGEGRVREHGERARRWWCGIYIYIYKIDKIVFFKKKTRI